MKLETFVDVQKAIAKSGRTFHLLLGNGFSMSYDAKIFSYNALHDVISTLHDETLSRLFEIINTRDFELVMQHLGHFADFVEAFGNDSDLKTRVASAVDKLKSSLIDAVRELHPEHVFEIPDEKSAACANFLRVFLDTGGHLFTTNYDLLLYWVLMRNSMERSVDGFGRDPEDPDEDIPPEERQYSELRWGKYKSEQNVFYVHGALPLFDTGVEIIKEEYESGEYLLERITRRIRSGDYPVFVTAGNGTDKLTHIRHNRYLEHCYETLASIEGSLVTFGFNFGDRDDHIISAINRAARHGKKIPPRLWSIYVGVYSDDDRAHMEAIAHKFKCKVHIFDSRTAEPWGS